MSVISERISVLHVDDEPEFADMVAIFLEQEDERISVQTATGPNEGLAMAADLEVDCIVSDYDMPDLNGIEFFEAVREMQLEVPFILFTGKGSEEVASDAISVGITDYIQKDNSTDQYKVVANKVINAIERRWTQQELMKEQRRRTALFRNFPEPTLAIEFVDDAPIIRAMNPAFEDTFGYDATNAIGASANDLIVPSGRHSDATRIDRQAKRGDPVDTEVRRETTTGLRDFLFRSIPVVGEIDVYMVYEDITERKEQERTLREERGFIEQALDSLEDVFYVVNTDGTLYRWNDRLKAVTGYTDEQIADMYAVEFFPPDERERIGDAIEETLTTGRTIVEANLLTVEGDCIPFELTGKRLIGSDGDVTGLVGIGRNLADRKNRQRKLE